MVGSFIMTSGSTEFKNHFMRTNLQKERYLNHYWFKKRTHQTCSWAWQSTQSPEGNWLHVCSWRWHGNSSQWFHSTQWPRRSAHPVGCSPLWSRWCEWTHGAQTRTQWVGIHRHLWVVSMTMWQTFSQHQQFSVDLLVGRVDLNNGTNQSMTLWSHIGAIWTRGTLDVPLCYAKGWMTSLNKSCNSQWELYWWKSNNIKSVVVGADNRNDVMTDSSAITL